MRKIEVVPYDSAWPDLYRVAASQLAEVFADQLVAIYHIGSTAVPGLAAKPVIDIMPMVQEIAQVDTYNPALLALGYEPRGEYGIPGRRYFVKRSGLVHHLHVHVYQRSHPEIERHLNFRDYLIAYPAVAQQYSQLKVQLAQKFPNDSGRYTEGKSDFIRSTNEVAQRWRER